MGIFSRLNKIFHKSDKQDRISAEEPTVAEMPVSAKEPIPADETPKEESAEQHELKIDKKPGIEIPYGDYALNVHGLVYHKIPLMNSDDCLFTLTVRNEYQKQHEWPEEGCVNVNALGSKETTGTNWVGYIRSYNTQKLLGLVEEHETVNAHAKVTVDKDELSMALMVPQSLAPMQFNISEKSWIGFSVSRTRRLHNVDIVLLEPEGKRKPHVGIVGSNGKVIFEVQARVSDGYETIKEKCGQKAREVIVQRKKSDFDEGYYYHVEFDFESPIDDWII